jgi:hypothetical protein
MKSKKSWHGSKYYFGLHYDLHATEKDTELGLRCSPKELVPIFRLQGASRLHELVQQGAKRLGAATAQKGCHEAVA